MQVCLKSWLLITGFLSAPWPLWEPRAWAWLMFGLTHVGPVLVNLVHRVIMPGRQIRQRLSQTYGSSAIDQWKVGITQSPEPRANDRCLYYGKFWTRGALGQGQLLAFRAGSRLEGNNVGGRPIRQQHLSPACCLAVQMANLWTYPGRCFHNNYFTTDHSMQLQCKSMKQRNWVIWPNDGKVNSLSIVAIAHQLIVKPNTPL